jgi:two-component system OmpR family response regulator
MNETKAILIVDDEPQIRSMLDRYLAREGYTVMTATSGEEMRIRLAERVPDLVLLDLILPGEDGLELAKQLRANHPSVGIIMLTAKSEEVDKVVGLEMGADDYVPKPFSLRELLARIKSVMRRLNNVEPSLTLPQVETGILAFTRWRLDMKNRRLMTDDGKDAGLTPGEFALLKVLVDNANRVLSREQLLDMTRGHGADSFDRTVDVQVNRLRQKVEINPRNPAIIKTVRGGGYVFASPLRPV